MRLLHHDRLQSNLWQHLSDDAAVQVRAATTVSLSRWQREREQLKPNAGVLGVRIAGDDRVYDLVADLVSIRLIVIEIANFADGRAFSQVRLLRERFGFSGEIRVRGNFLLDQIDAFLRAGADSFELPETIDSDDAINAARRQGIRYQPPPRTQRANLDRGRLVVH